MAQELEHFDSPGLTIYAKPSPLVVSPWATDVVSLSESGTVGGYYSADVASPATQYLLFEQAGGSPADTDTAIATITTGIATLVTGQPAQKYNGVRGPGVYLDTATGTAGTTLGTHGTVDNPTDTLANAVTLAASVGANRIYLKGESTLALTGQTLDGYELIGLNGVDSNTVNLGTAASPSTLSNFAIYGCRVYGTHDFSDRLTLVQCNLDDAPAAETTALHVQATKCLLVGDITLDASSDNVFYNCSDGEPGAINATITATGSTGTFLFLGWVGGITFASLSASHKVQLAGWGRVTWASSCNVNAEVELYGHWSETDNTAGMADITRNASFSLTSVNTEADTAITDASLATLANQSTIITAIAGIDAGAAGSGALTTLVTIEDGAAAGLADAQAWVTTSAAGTNVVAGTLVTDSNGQVTFLLDASTQYYLFAQKNGRASIVASPFYVTDDGDGTGTVVEGSL